MPFWYLSSPSVQLEIKRKDLFTTEELQAAAVKLKLGKATGLDGILDEVLSKVVGGYPDMLLKLWGHVCLGDDFIKNRKFKISSYLEEGKISKRGSHISNLKGRGKNMRR